MDCKFARSLGVVDGSEEVSEAEMALGVKGVRKPAASLPRLPGSMHHERSYLVI